MARRTATNMRPCPAYKAPQCKRRAGGYLGQGPSGKPCRKAALQAPTSVLCA
jgi:hypothetical protein